MPTRSITLKLVVPRHPEKRAAAQALWSTHCAVNEAVHYYERHLLLMRGEAYRKRTEAVAKDAVVAEALRLARDAQRRNGADPAAGSDEEITALLRRLYEEIIPSVIGQSGSAKNANGFLGPLTDPKSKGHSKATEVLDLLPPDWLEGAKAKDPDAIAAANAWLSTREAAI